MNHPTPHHHTPLIPLSTKAVNSDKRRGKILKPKIKDFSKTKYEKVDNKTWKEIKN